MSHISEQADNHKVEGFIPSNKWGSDVAISSDAIARNLLEIEEKTAHYNSRIIAVTKYYGVDALVNAGLEVPTYDTYDVLVIGSKLLGNCEETAPLASMIQLAQGKELHLQYVTHSVGVLNKLAKKDSSDTFYSSYKAALVERKWDAVIIPVS